MHYALRSLKNNYNNLRAFFINLVDSDEEVTLEEEIFYTFMKT